MRAAVFRGVGVPLAIERRQRPSAGAGGVVIKVAYAGICGSDLHATEPNPVPLEAGTVLGHEFAGTVADSADPTWQLGERVIGVPLEECADCRPAGKCREGLGILCGRGRIVGLSAAVPGAYAEYVRLGARHVLKVPERVSLRAAALAEPLAVGAHAVRLAGPLYGRSVLVVGAGPIGLAVTAFARFAGARAVTVSEPDPTRRARAGGQGATALVDPGGARLAQAVADAAEVIFECVGAPGLIAQCMELARVHGRIVVVGVNRGEDTILPRAGIRKELELRFVLGYQREDFALVLDLLASGRIDAERMVTRVIGLDEVPEVFEALRLPNPEGKVLIEPGR